MNKPKICKLFWGKKKKKFYRKKQSKPKNDINTHIQGLPDLLDILLVTIVSKDTEGGSLN